MSFRLATLIHTAIISVLGYFGETPRAIALKVTTFQRIVLVSINLNFGESILRGFHKKTYSKNVRREEI